MRRPTAVPSKFRPGHLPFRVMVLVGAVVALMSGCLFDPYGCGTESRGLEAAATLRIGADSTTGFFRFSLYQFRGFSEMVSLTYGFSLGSRLQDSVAWARVHQARALEEDGMIRSLVRLTALVSPFSPRSAGETRVTSGRWGRQSRVPRCGVTRRQAPYPLLLGLLGGCSPITGPVPELTLSFVDNSDLGPSARFEVDGRTYWFHEAGRRTIEAGTGKKRVGIGVYDADGGERAATDFDLDVARKDRRYWIQVYIDDVRPSGHCLGSVTPVGALESDSIFVLQGSIPVDAVC